MNQIVEFYPDHQNQWDYYLTLSEWLTSQEKFKNLNQHRNEWIKPIIKNFIEVEKIN
jgi:hypothetical protein